MYRSALQLAVLMGAVGLCGGGCVLFPTRMEGYDDHGTHARVDDELYRSLAEGVTTRDQVRERVGRRDVELAGGRVWAYSWEKRGSLGFYLGAAAPSGAGGGEFVNDSSSIHYLFLEFDDAGVLRRKMRRDGGRINGQAQGLDDVMIKN